VAKYIESRKRFKNIVLENRPHLDEICGRWQLRKFGKEIFPGVDTAETVFLQKELENTYDDDIYVGVGGLVEKPNGVVFDEHVPEGRLEDSCAATLIAPRLRVGGKLNGLLTEVLQVDSEGGVKAWQLASLVGAMHRVKKGEDQMKTLAWADDALNAIAFGDRDEHVNVKKIWYDYCSYARLDLSSGAVKHVSKVVAMSCLEEFDFVTGISNVAKRMRPDLRLAWLGKTFEILVADSELYQESLKLKFESEDIETDHGFEPLVYMSSDNEHALRAGNSGVFGKPAIFVLRNTSLKGMLLVCNSKNERIIEAFMDLCAMIRMAEFQKRTGNLLSFKKARGMGKIIQCPQWCMPYPTLMANKTLTHPGVEETVLTLDEIVEIVRRAFKASYRDEWISRYSAPPTEIGVDVEISLEAVFDKVAQNQYHSRKQA
jgi:hypothetical protein